MNLNLATDKHWITFAYTPALRVAAAAAGTPVPERLSLELTPLDIPSLDVLDGIRYTLTDEGYVRASVDFQIDAVADTASHLLRALALTQLTKVVNSPRATASEALIALAREENASRVDELLEKQAAERQASEAKKAAAAADAAAKRDLHERNLAVYEAGGARPYAATCSAPYEYNDPLNERLRAEDRKRELRFVARAYRSIFSHDPRLSVATEEASLGAVPEKEAVAFLRDALLPLDLREYVKIHSAEVPECQCREGYRPGGDGPNFSATASDPLEEMTLDEFKAVQASMARVKAVFTPERFGSAFAAPLPEVSFQLQLHQGICGCTDSKCLEAVTRHGVLVTLTFPCGLALSREYAVYLKDENDENGSLTYY